MSWSITGSRVGTVLAVSDSGLPICHGEGRHEPRPLGLYGYGGNINHALLSRLQKSKCAWTIALPSEAPVNIDGNDQGLIERIQQAPEKAHGMITFFSDPDLVGIVSVVPEPAFAHIRRLLELVLLSESLRYSIALDFLGFRVPHATTSTPSWEEFMSGKPYFFNEMDVALSTNDA
ncbi:MAG: hypothetical protein H0V34_13470 [Gammaproteobacteria bacterium]|nr:hypothetical protein [Gammaproteobacteria bacterium]